jgi:hypothetical protein
MADQSTPLSDKEIAELRSLVKLLDKEMSDVEFNNLLASGPAAKKLLNDLRGEAYAFTSNISDTALSFKRVLNEIKNTQSGVNDAARAYKGILSIAEQLQSHQKGISELNEKDLSKLQQKLSLNIQSLKNASELLVLEEQDLKNQERFKNTEKDRVKFQINALEAAKKALKNQLNADGTRKKLSKDDQERLEKLKNTYSNVDKELNKIGDKLKTNKNTQIEISGIIEGEDAHYKTLTSTIDTVNRQLKDQKELLGLGGVAVEGIGKALNKIGLGGFAGALGIDEAQKKMKDFSSDIIKNREKELALQHQVKQNEEEIAKTLANEKALEDEIAASRGALSDSQLRSGFGGKELKLKQLELDAIKAGRGEQEKVLSQNQANLNTLSASNKQYAGMKGTIAVLQQGAKALWTNLTKALNPASLILAAIDEIIDAMKIIDSGAGDMAKGMNMTYSEALKTREELGTIADLSGDAAVTTKGLQESLMAVGQALGSNAKLNEADLVTMTKLTKQAGFTHDELMGIQKISLVNGKTLEDNTKEVLGSAKAHASMRGLMINEKDVLREVNKMSASLKLSLGGSADKMAEAVVQAKAFGLSLEQAEKMAEGLLSFESSISSELEAEMLTGRSLNFEKARLLALNNDVAGAAEEIAKQVGTSADFAKMNRLQQEAIAKATGLTRDELAQSLMDKEALAALSAKEGETAQMAFDRLVKEVGMEEAKKRLGDQELARQYEQQSVQERFNQTVEKLKEVFTRIAEPLMSILDPIMEVVESLMPLVNILLLPLMGTLKIIGKLISFSLVEPIKFVGNLITELVLEPLKAFGKAIFGPIKSFGDIIDKYIMSPFRALRDIVYTAVVSPLKAAGNFIFTYLVEPFKAVKEFLGGIIDIFTGDFGEGLAKMGKGILRGILTPVQALLNGGIGIINGAIKIANKIPGVNIGEVKDFNLADSIMGDDVISKAGYGERTLLSPEGSIKLNDNDTIIAGTKLLDDPNKQFQQRPSIEAPQSSSIFSKILQSVTAPISMMSKGAQSILGSVLPSTTNESSDVILSIKDILLSIYDIISKNINPKVAEKITTSKTSSVAADINKQTDTLITDANKTINDLATDKSKEVTNKLNEPFTLLKDKNLIEETIATIATKIGSLFNPSSLVPSGIDTSLNPSSLISSGIDTLLKPFSLIQSMFDDSSSSITPVVSEGTPSLEKYVNTSIQNNNTSDISNVNSNTPLDTTAVAEILKSIDIGIKNLNTKDGNITITLDKDVIGSKVTPVVNTFNNKTKSGVQF